VSNQKSSDTHFFNSFSLVLGILVALAIMIFALARVVGGGAQARNVQTERLYLKEVQTNIEPVAHVAIAGKDNSALASLAPAKAEGPAQAVPASGEQAYQQICSACHAAGIAGAPKIGDHAAWGPRIAQGKDTLYKHALGGFAGGKGVMPARGGTTWPDATIRQAVDYMVSLNSK
jgi:cytochrome c5